MASRDDEDRTGREYFDSQTNEIRNLPNNDEIHHQLFLNHCTFPCSLSCMKRGLILNLCFKRGAYLRGG